MFSSWGLSKEFYYDIFQTIHECIVCVCVILNMLLCVLQILITIYLFYLQHRKAMA